MDARSAADGKLLSENARYARFCAQSCILLALLVCGCSSPFPKQVECKTPEVMELKKFASLKELHFEVVDYPTGPKYHVRLWPYSEGYECNEWAWVGISNDLGEAISDAKQSYAIDRKVTYEREYEPPKVLCHK